eukprot:jgi/Mesvir1/24976/Mv25662-RA.2
MPQGVWGACKSLPSRRWDTDATTVSATGELDPSPTYTAEAKSPTSPSRAGAFSAVPGVPYMRGGATAVVEYSGGQDKDKVVSNPPPMLRSRLGMQRQVGTDSFGNDSEASSVDSGSLRLGSTRGSGEFLGMTPMASEAGGEADDELSDDGMHGDDCRQVPNSSESGGDGGLGGTMGWYQTRIDVKDLLPYVPSIVLDDMFVPTKPSSSTADALRAGVAGGVSPPHDKDKDKEGEEGAVLRSFPYCSCMFAGVVIADVSGFSMLGELLYAYGDVGVEVFSEVLNYVLGAMISVVVEWEGQVTKIAGDALCGNVGSAARCEMAVVGRSVNLSARLACKAPQDGILVDDSIHRYTWGHVQYKPLGKMKFKGKEESVDVYVPVCELPHRMQSGYRRVSYMGHDATIPDLGLVGRSLEISELMACLSSMRHLRRGSVIIIDGEAGVGKTEMLRKLHLLARNMSIKVLMATGHTLEEANPYHFYTQLLSQLLDIPVMMDTTPGPNIAITRARLERKLEALLDPVTARDVPLLAIMFPDLVDGENHVGAVVNTSGVFGELSEDACFQPTPRRTSRNGESSGTLMPPSPAPSKGRKSPLARDADCASLSSNARRLLNLMKGIVSAVARRTPCVALVDDSLYMDSAFNRQLVTLLASLCKVMPVMLVMSHTTTPASAAPIPAEGNSSPPAALASSGTPAKSVAATDHKGMVALLHALMGAPNTKVLRLRCFTRVETGLFAMQVLNLARLPEELLAFVHSKTGGNPLFVKELLLCIRKSKCMLMDAGAQALTIDFSSIKLSNNMRAILVSRLDRLEPFARDILKHAACIGLQFGELQLLELLSWVYLNVCEVSGEKLHAALEGLAAHQIIAPLPSAPGGSPLTHPPASATALAIDGASSSDECGDGADPSQQALRWESLDLPDSPAVGKKVKAGDAAPDIGWVFCLSLLHDAVYGLMPASEKRRLHAFIEMRRNRSKHPPPPSPTGPRARQGRRSLEEPPTRPF